MISAACLLDSLPETQAREALLRCCGSRRWAQEMLRSRPYSDDATLFQAADAVWFGLTADDWREAFSHHPRIGDKRLQQNPREDAATPQKTAEGDAWAAQEQAGAAAASARALRDLEEGNRAYEKRFGHIFLICATGLSADRMLDSLRRRLGNDPATELSIAAREQAKITRLRLEKLAGEGAGAGLP